GVRCLLAGGADRDYLEVRQRLQGWHVGDGGEATVRRDADHADADLACHDDVVSLRRWAASSSISVVGDRAISARYLIPISRKQEPRSPPWPAAMISAPPSSTTLPATGIRWKSSPLV